MRRSCIPEGRVVLQAILLGNNAVFEGDMSVLDDPQRHLVLDLLNLETRALVLYDEALHLTVGHIPRPDDG
jgi:hypothetical protein